MSNFPLLNDYSNFWTSSPSLKQNFPLSRETNFGRGPALPKYNTCKTELKIAPALLARPTEWSALVRLTEATSSVLKYVQ